MLEVNLGTKIANVQSRLDAVAARLEWRFEAVESRFELRIETVASRLGIVKVELGSKIDRMGAAVDTLKWLFGFVAAMNLAIFVRLVLTP
jgi:hypothetical protein